MLICWPIPRRLTAANANLTVNSLRWARSTDHGAEALAAKSAASLDLDAKIADQRKVLDQLQADAAAVVSKLTAIAGGGK